MKRRNFILGSTALGGALAANFGLSSLAFARVGGRTKTIVKVFQRGGADGLHLFPPTNDMNYYAARPTIRVEPANGDATSAIELKGSASAPNPNNKIAMNPNLAPLLRIWEDGGLAISPATHYDNAIRSHFHTQKTLEFGGDIKTGEGFLNRYLKLVDPHLNDTNVMRAVRSGVNTVAPVFIGDISVPIVRDSMGGLMTEDFCSGSGCSDNQLTEMVRSLSNVTTDNELENHVRRADTQIVDTIEIVKVSSRHSTNAGGLEYSDTDIGRGLKLVSQLLKDGTPLEVASVNWTAPTWDTHADHVSNGQSIADESIKHVKLVKQGANDLLTFYLDMKNSNMLDDVIVIVGSEFGRTVHQNGSFGTDHGHASTWFAYGGPTKGGVYSPFDNLRDENLHAGRYVPHIVSYQDIVGEAMWRHLGLDSATLSGIFPDHTFTDNKMFS